MADQSKAIATGAIGVGGILLWSAINNKKALVTTQNLVRGKATAPGPEVTPGSVTQIGGNAEIPFGTVGTSGAPAAPSSTSGNVSLGKLLAAPFGWSTGSNWNSLYALWERESGWSNTAENKSSGAYGIAQALGHGPTNQYPAGPANPPISSATAQILWGLGYIKSTYGNPDNAWAHETANGWY